MRFMRVALTLALVSGACTPAQNGDVDGADPPASAVSADSRVTMERLPCFGTCPVYTVAVNADGTVTFDGQRHVDSAGSASRRIAPEAAASLFRELVAGGFFDLAEKYTMNAKACGLYHTDAPRVIMTARIDGRMKTVEHDYGCGGAPASLRVLQERVDSVAGVARWVGPR